MGFDALVQQYAALMAEIDNKKWALSELRQTQDDELSDLWNQRWSGTTVPLLLFDPWTDVCKIGFGVTGKELMPNPKICQVTWTTKISTNNTFLISLAPIPHVPAAPTLRQKKPSSTQATSFKQRNCGAESKTWKFVYSAESYQGRFSMLWLLEIWLKTICFRQTLEHFVDATSWFLKQTTCFFAPCRLDTWRLNMLWGSTIKRNNHRYWKSACWQFSSQKFSQNHIDHDSEKYVCPKRTECRDVYIYIKFLFKIKMSITRSIYVYQGFIIIHQDWQIYIKVYKYRSRLINIHQAS